MKVALLGAYGLLAFLLLCAGRDLSAQSGPALASTSTRAPQVASYMERIRREPPALRAFLRALPKGADLHTHLSGAIYAESYIQWAADLPLCIELSTSSFVPAVSGPPATCRNPTEQRPASQILQDPSSTATSSMRSPRVTGIQVEPAAITSSSMRS